MLAAVTSKTHSFKFNHVVNFLLQIKENIRSRILYYFLGFLAWCHFNVAVLNYDKCYSRGPFGCRLHFGSDIHKYYDAIDNEFIAVWRLFILCKCSPRWSRGLITTLGSQQKRSKSKTLIRTWNKISWIAVFFISSQTFITYHRVRPTSYYYWQYWRNTFINR